MYLWTGKALREKWTPSVLIIRLYATHSWFGKLHTTFQKKEASRYLKFVWKTAGCCTMVSSISFHGEKKKTCLRMASRSVPETMGRGAEVARSLGRGQVGIPWAKVTKSHMKSVDRSSLPGRNPGWCPREGVDFSIGKSQERSGNTFHKSPLGSGDILLGIPKLSTPLVDPEAEKSAGQTPECCCNVLEAPGGSYPTLVDPSSDALWVSELRTSHRQGAGSGRQVQI